MRNGLRLSVAAEVRAELARQRRSGADLARHLNVSEMTVSRRLNGSTPFDLDEVDAVAAFLSVPVSRLLGEAA